MDSATPKANHGENQAKENSGVEDASLLSPLSLTNVGLAAAEKSRQGMKQKVDHSDAKDQSERREKDEDSQFGDQHESGQSHDDDGDEDVSGDSEGGYVRKEDGRERNRGTDGDEDDVREEGDDEDGEVDDEDALAFGIGDGESFSVSAASHCATVASEMSQTGSEETGYLSEHAPQHSVGDSSEGAWQEGQQGPSGSRGHDQGGGTGATGERKRGATEGAAAGGGGLSGGGLLRPRSSRGLQRKSSKKCSIS